MKTKVLLFVLCVGAALTTRAQFDPGTITVGGNIFIASDKITEDYKDNSYYDDEETSLTTFSLMPRIGYMVQPDLEVGGSLGLSYVGEKYDYGDGEETSSANIVTLAPYAIKYIAVFDNAGIMLDMGLSFGFGNFPDYDMTMTLFELGVTPGFYIKLTDELLLTGTFGFLGFASTTYTNTESDNKMKYSHAGLSLNQNRLDMAALDSDVPAVSTPNLSIGVKYYLSK